MKKCLKNFAHSLFTALCSTALAILISLLWQGIPLIGIPQAEHITQVEITHASIGETRTVYDKEKIATARSCLGFLKYRLKAAAEESPQIMVRYWSDSGRIYEVSAGSHTVFYQGKAHSLRDSEIFINIVEGIFFSDVTVAPQ